MSNANSKEIQIQSIFRLVFLTTIYWLRHMACRRGVKLWGAKQALTSQKLPVPVAAAGKRVTKVFRALGSV